MAFWPLTLPSAVLMVLAASLLSAHPSWIDGVWVHGLMVAAVAVVAQAFLGLQRKLAPDLQRTILMVATAVGASRLGQLLAPLLGGLLGLCALPPPELEPTASERLVVPLRRSFASVLLGFAVLLFMALPWLTAEARPLLVQRSVVSCAPVPGVRL